MSRIARNQRARSVAAFAGAAVLGASIVAWATPQCEDGPRLEMEVVSVTVDGVEQPIPANNLDFGMSEGGDVNANNIYATLHDPDTGKARVVELVQVEP